MAGDACGLQIDDAVALQGEESLEWRIFRWEFDFSRLDWSRLVCTECG